MHRLKSPLFAMIAAILLVGPVLGRITQVDTSDPYQISTPSAWERSTQETTPVAEPGFQFVHGERVDDSNLGQRSTIGDDILLISPSELALINRASMTELWSFEPEFEILRISIYTRADNPLNPRIGVLGESTCVLLNAADAEVIWEKQGCQTGSMNSRDDGTFLYFSRDDALQTMTLLDEVTGEEFWSYSYQWSLGVSRVEESKDGQVFFITTRTSVDTISALTGEILWSAPITDEFGILLVGSHLLVLRNEEIIGLDAATGAEVWFSFVEPGYFIDQSYIQPDSVEKIFVQYGSTLAILDVSTGLELQRFEDSRIVAASFQDGDSNTIFPDVIILQIGNDTVGVRWETLEEAWKIRNTGSISGFGRASNGLVLLPTNDGRVIFVDATTGESALVKNATDYRRINDGSSVLLHNDRSLEAIDASSLQKLWTFTPPDEIRLWNSTSDEVLVGTQRYVYVINPSTGEVIGERAHPQGWQRYILNNRFAFHWDGSNVTATHHLSGHKTNFNAIYDFDDFSISATGDVTYLRYGSTITMLNQETGRQIYSSNFPLEFTTNEGEFVMIMGESNSSSVRYVESTGDIRWETEIPPDFIHLNHYVDAGKILLRARTNALMIDVETGEIIMELPIAYDPDGENDTLYLSTADAVLVGSDYASAIYSIPHEDSTILAEETVIRGAPSATGVERATFPAGTVVTPTGNSQERADGMWLEVRVDNVTGWIHEDDLVSGPVIPAATPGA